MFHQIYRVLSSKHGVPRPIRLNARSHYRVRVFAAVGLGAIGVSDWSLEE
jgi:hypothetical protein